MVFNSDVFLFAFFPIVFLLFWMTSNKQQRYLLMTVAGFVFYGYWDWRYCGLLLFSSLFSFGMGMAIDRSKERRTRLLFMTASIVVDLGLLGFFKYYNFFVSSLESVAPGFSAPILSIVLPVGISFYTFHTLSYVIDVTAGRVRATYNVLEYLTYVSMFFQLVAGPIVRFRQIEQDLERIDKRPREQAVALGLGFFVIGLTKKVIVGDQIADLIDPMIADYTRLTTADAWLAALGYALQLYFDFSGYSDMAVGLGHLFGIRIPQNFDAPYRAVSITDFWRRWHISLSSWLRDYLYIPLGGNRVGAVRTYANLLVTMLLGGLWHGANWTFVIWGGYHGLLLALERGCRGLPLRLPLVLARVSTFLLVLVGWVIFRSTDLTMALTWLGRMFSPAALAVTAPRELYFWVLLGLGLITLLPETWDLRFGTSRRWLTVYATMFFVAYLFMNGKQTVFLYYQF